ncbi:MAG: hypothetical protein ACRDGR_10200 [bacterium]
MIRRALVLAAAGTVAILGAGPAEGGVGRPTLPGIRPLGMGNAFVAVVDDRNALHYNPAGLGRLTELEISGAGVYAGVDDEFVGLIDFIQQHEQQFADFDTMDQQFYDELASWDDRWIAVDASAHADVTRPGFGAGAFTVGRVQFKADRGVYEPRVAAQVYDDIVGVVGGSRGFAGGDVQVGATFKAVWRRETSRTLTAREVLDLDPETVFADLEKAQGGFSSDIGVLLHRDDSRWSAGAVLRDVVGTVGGEDIDSAIDLGLAWQAVRDGAIVRTVTLAVDRRDLFGGGAFGNGMHVGGEVRLPVLSLRCGFNQGYPTFGVSLDARVLAIDYAYFGRELGAFPGSEEQHLHAVEARLGF